MVFALLAPRNKTPPDWPVYFTFMQPTNAVQGMPLIWAGACARPHATAVKIAPPNVIQLPEQKQLTTLLASRL